MTGPAGPLTADTFTLETGTLLYRLFTNNPGRHAGTFNPGLGAPTRFAFFGNPVVPVLYAGESEIAVISETLLHDIPADGGALFPGDYTNKVMGRLIARRPLRLASFMGTGFRTLGTAAEDITRTPASRYAETVRWAEAAHDAGFEGIAWMSWQCDTEKAYVFFGDRANQDDFEVDPTYGRAFALPDDADWLTRLCTPLRIEVRR